MPERFTSTSQCSKAWGASPLSSETCRKIACCSARTRLCSILNRPCSSCGNRCFRKNNSAPFAERTRPVCSHKIPEPVFSSNGLRDFPSSWFTSHSTEVPRHVDGRGGHGDDRAEGGYSGGARIEAGVARRRENRQSV